MSPARHGAATAALRRPRKGYPKEARIRRRAEFTACYEQGERLYTAHFLLFLLAGEGRARTGMAVSRKVGNAVTRNRVKRLLREFFRLHARQIPTGDLVVVARRQAGEGGLGLAEVRGELLPLLEKPRRTRRPRVAPRAEVQSS